MSGIISRYHPFTETQWQELEHQALFFKFMVSGRPIPSDLIFRIKGTNSQPHHIGWTCFQMGMSQSVDPEPTRCRRTDGKKWRCSRQTTGDSKYCERHMHRGKSRTRKLPDAKQPLPKVEARTTSQQSASSISQYKSNLSSVTSDMTHRQSFNLFNTHSPKPVKASTFMTFLDIESPEPDKSENGDKIMYHQFIEESPQAEGKRESWLNLNLVI